MDLGRDHFTPPGGDDEEETVSAVFIIITPAAVVASSVTGSLAEPTIVDFVHAAEEDDELDE